MEPNELDQVRNLIEKSTSKVSLRDLERKGFRKVKVLRSNDIDQMIRRAVEQALAAGVRDHEQLVQRSREAVNEQMAAAKQAQAEINALQAQAEAASREGMEAKAQLTKAQEHLRAREREAQDLRRRLADAEERADGLGGRAEAAKKAQAKAAALRDELDDASRQLKQLEMEKRLLEELEVPKLRQRVQELEVELRAARSQGAPAADPEVMRAMLREVVQEVGGGKGGGDVAGEIAKLQNAILSMGRGGAASGPVTEADEQAMKVSLASLFSHEDKKDVETNITNVQVKESTGRGVKANLNKLKSLRQSKDG